MFSTGAAYTGGPQVTICRISILRAARKPCTGPTVGVFDNTSHSMAKLRQSTNMYAFIRFLVFTAVTMKKAVFWDVTPCDHMGNFPKDSLLHVFILSLTTRKLNFSRHMLIWTFILVLV
jgi:hypothetical protein